MWYYVHEISSYSGFHLYNRRTSVELYACMHMMEKTIIRPAKVENSDAATLQENGSNDNTVSTQLRELE